MNIAVPTLETRRSEALDRFRSIGVPHRRIEEWKYTDLKAALSAEDVAHAGALPWSISALPDGVQMVDLASGKKRAEWVEKNLGMIGGEGVMNAAAFAFAQAGVALRVARNTIVGTPLNLRFTSAGHARVLIILEEGAELTLVEHHEAGEAFRNIGMEVSIGPNAQFTHVRVAEAAHNQIQIETISATLSRDARYCGHYTDLGAKISRVEANLTLAGAGADVQISGVSVLSGDTHADVTTNVDHAVGNTTSTQLFKKLIGGHARGVYQGKVSVRQHADKSNSSQTAKAILLSNRAEADLKPELEIFADDVKCDHGAAVGDLDLESLFYLRSRGLPEDEARALLMRAFVEDAVAQITDEVIRADVWKIVENALASVSEGK